MGRQGGGWAASGARVGAAGRAAGRVCAAGGDGSSAVGVGAGGSRSVTGERSPAPGTQWRAWVWDRCAGLGVVSLRVTRREGWGLCSRVCVHACVSVGVRTRPFCERGYGACVCVCAWGACVWGWYVQGKERDPCVRCWEERCASPVSVQYACRSKGAEDVSVFAHFCLYVCSKRLMVQGI